MSQTHSTPAHNPTQPPSDVRLFYVGFDGDRVVDSQTTRTQIDAVKALECALRSDHGFTVHWDVFDNPQEPRTLFQYVLGDRRIRVDQHTAMADRPPIAVVTAVGNRAVRLEFYEGHDELECTFDLRSPETAGKTMPRWMDKDPYAYDPIAFLQEVLPELMGGPSEEPPWTRNPFLNPRYVALWDAPARGEADPLPPDVRTQVDLLITERNSCTDARVEEIDAELVRLLNPFVKDGRP